MKPALRHCGDAREDVGQPGERIDVVEFCRHDKRADGRRAVGAALGTGEEP
jgi:hypothetical protein